MNFLSKTLSTAGASAPIGFNYVNTNTWKDNSSRLITSNKFTEKIVIRAKMMSILRTTSIFLPKVRTFQNSHELSTPRTELARKLLAHRTKVLASGRKLLTADEINLMVNEGRGNYF